MVRPQELDVTSIVLGGVEKVVVQPLLNRVRAPGDLPRRAHLASVSLSQDFGQVFVIPTSAEAALTDTMLVCPMMF